MSKKAKRWRIEYEKTRRHTNIELNEMVWDKRAGNEINKTKRKIVTNMLKMIIVKMN